MLRSTLVGAYFLKLSSKLHQESEYSSISKESSAELSEAINSMFAWYKNSAVCYAYLSDVDWFDIELHDDEERFDRLNISRWFSRG